MSVWGCGKDTTFIALNNSISEKRISVASGKTEGVSATIMCGYRERDYVINGVASELIEFCVLTFYIDGFEAYDFIKADYILNIGLDRFTGELELNPFDNSLVTDIGKIFNINENVMAKLQLNGKTYKIYFSAVSSDWAVGVDEAIKIYVDTFRTELKNYVVSDKLNGEVYVKILYDTSMDEYFWHINFVTPNGVNIASVINIHNGEVLTNNTNIF
ncbi:MAG: hypothetical protein IJW28_03235 [Clostridia bacterium]|nr:hypothetical protein [Clostridia bacterium]